MSNPVSVLLCGIGGYGNFYVDALLRQDNIDAVQIKGVVDPNPQGCQRLTELEAREIPFYSDLAEFYRHQQVDLAVLSSPVQLHAQQIQLSLQHGTSVLCEKPLCSTVEDGLEVIATRDRLGGFVSIGYQWSHSEAIQNLKGDIQAGVLGKPKRLKSMVLWPRDFAYYNRNSWAGKVADSEGLFILDSVAHNATAHYIHNMFYLLGSRQDRSAFPLWIEAETYRANAIETYDTIALRCLVEPDIEVLYYATHASANVVNPQFCFEFEDAVVEYAQDRGPKAAIVAKFANGKEKNYGDPFADDTRKLWHAVDAVRTGEPILCGPEAALAEVAVITAVHRANPQATSFPEELIRTRRDEQGQAVAVFVSDLGKVLEECYRTWRLPHEYGVSWAKVGERFTLKPLLPKNLITSDS